MPEKIEPEVIYTMRHNGQEFRIVRLVNTYADEWRYSAEVLEHDATGQPSWQYCSEKGNVFARFVFDAINNRSDISDDVKNLAFCALPGGFLNVPDSIKVPG